MIPPTCHPLGSYQPPNRGRNSFWGRYKSAECQDFVRHVLVEIFGLEALFGVEGGDFWIEPFAAINSVADVRHCYENLHQHMLVAVLTGKNNHVPAPLRKSVILDQTNLHKSIFGDQMYFHTRSGQRYIMDRILNIMTHPTLNVDRHNLLEINTVSRSNIDDLLNRILHGNGTAMYVKRDSKIFTVLYGYKVEFNLESRAASNPSSTVAIGPNALAILNQDVYARMVDILKRGGEIFIKEPKACKPDFEEKRLHYKAIFDEAKAQDRVFSQRMKTANTHLKRHFDADKSSFLTCHQNGWKLAGVQNERGWMARGKRPRQEVVGYDGYILVKLVPKEN